MAFCDNGTLRKGGRMNGWRRLGIIIAVIACAAVFWAVYDGYAAHIRTIAANEAENKECLRNAPKGAICVASLYTDYRYAPEVTARVNEATNNWLTLLLIAIVDLALIAIGWLSVEGIVAAARWVRRGGF
jgi:hypothetical protein